MRNLPHKTKLRATTGVPSRGAPLSRSDFRVQSLSVSENVLGPVPSRERGMECNFGVVRFGAYGLSPLICGKGCWPGSALHSLLLARPQHAAPHHHSPCLLCHACIVEGDRPRRAAVHDKSLHVSLVRDVQQSRRAYPKLHPGNIHRGRLYPNTGYAVRRYPSECKV